MALTIVTTTDERLLSPAACAGVRAGSSTGAVTLLVPSFAQALQAQKDLAQVGMCLGLQVGTPESWARDCWDIWGDGSRQVDATQRILLARDVLCAAAQNDARSVVVTPGTVRLFASLAENSLPWAREALERVQTSLTDAESSIVELLEGYRHELRRRGLAETSQIMCDLPAAFRTAGICVAPVVCAGFDALSRARRELLVGLAQQTSVTLVVRVGEGAAYSQQRHLISLMEERAAACGVAVTHKTVPGESATRAQELSELCQHLFAGGVAPMLPTGSVKMLEPSGPLAEAELVAREVEHVARELARGADEPGCDARPLARGAEESVRIAVVVPDAQRAMRELVPKLVARGMDVRTQLSVPVLQTEAGRAFMGFVRSVASLAERDVNWPAPREGQDGTLVQLGSMDWWPPSDLMDFLLSDMAQVGATKARALAVAWRSNRLLTPADVLSQLQSAKHTSSAVERATRELLKGRLGSAASKLLATYATRAAVSSGGQQREAMLADEEAVQVLSAVMGVAGALKDLGVTADPTVEDHVPLADLVERAELALQSTRVTLRLKAPAAVRDEVVSSQGVPPSVYVLTRGQAARLESASVDVAVLCGLTSAELSVGTGDDVLHCMLEELGIEPHYDPLSEQRVQFARLVALPKHQLLLERTMFQADSHETYPAVMLTELLACYDARLPKDGLSEDVARANLSVRGVAPAPVAAECPEPSGHVDPDLRRLVSVPQEGRAELPGGLPVLSASQLESYLECPLKWFSLRRLRLLDNDAGFGPLETGTFVHRVLELTYTQLFEEGRASLPLGDADALAHAQSVLDACFSLHEEHQYLPGTRAESQALVPHNSWEESGMTRLRRDLTSLLAYVQERFWGFEPRAFEWEFGRGRSRADGPKDMPSLAHASYAGVAVTGTVDRIDVNAHGQAIIVDYKHKGPVGFFGEYAIFPEGGFTPGSHFKLPRRIQSLMYAQVVRRAFPDLKVVGALYLGTRGDHELSGAVDECQAHAIFGDQLSDRRAKRIVVNSEDTFELPGEDDQADAITDTALAGGEIPVRAGVVTTTRGFESYLDATEAAIAAKVERLRAGHIEADPIDRQACAYCPVSNCERRMTR